MAGEQTAGNSPAGRGTVEFARGSSTKEQLDGGEVRPAGCQLRAPGLAAQQRPAAACARNAAAGTFAAPLLQRALESAWARKSWQAFVVIEVDAPW
jgi:hypothetical protein